MFSNRSHLFDLCARQRFAALGWKRCENGIRFIRVDGGDRTERRDFRCCTPSYSLVTSNGTRHFKIASHATRPRKAFIFIQRVLFCFEKKKRRLIFIRPAKRIHCEQDQSGKTVYYVRIWAAYRWHTYSFTLGRLILAVKPTNNPSQCRISAEKVTFYITRVDRLLFVFTRFHFTSTNRNVRTQASQRSSYPLENRTSNRHHHHAHAVTRLLFQKYFWIIILLTWKNHLSFRVLYEHERFHVRSHARRIGTSPLGYARAPAPRKCHGDAIELEQYDNECNAFVCDVLCFIRYAFSSVRKTISSFPIIVYRFRRSRVASAIFANRMCACRKRAIFNVNSDGNNK